MLTNIRHHLNLVHQAPHALRTLIQHMGIDHCDLYILVPEQFLDTNKKKASKGRKPLRG
jgi:hypothetical protein